ncbi:mucin-17 isoform X2 [Acyrthosiphon pisum]|uniref:VWFC domain-containing protein n=1 Tax=Acyrthosiphon pisum TaxID=7029 RepID=A0A8R1W3Q2_ACYPI|nr:mucin-17 isoform X2 [Acyrthosiphon pisum]|eukprot:XP_001952422.2 PREDICTED: mucin-17 isoform X2 [Acyrthosiphon pisum]
MQLDMALGSAAPTSFQHRCGVTAALILVVCVALTKSAPTTYDEIEAKRTDLADYFNDPNGCYYNYQHYEEGDRIVTNEPCLNCTCHNRMLMCYLRVCPFSKAIGQDCTVQKSPDQCCPTISCPEVPVHLLTSSTTPTPTTTTEIGWHDNYGCMMDENEFFPDGAQVPPNPKKPCELCYCIRNRTACIMQECTLHVEGCRPVYHEGVCCPVRYDCDYESEKSTTSAPQITGGLVFSTTSAPFDCRVNEETYRDGESIAMVSEKPCEHCYCMRGDIVCAVQDCGEPLRGKDCTPETPPAGQCCPTSYQCANETNSSYDTSTLQPMSLSDSDENEAEKFPLNEDVYNKLGESQPSSEQDDGNDVESDDTTAASPDNHNASGETNILPNSDNANKLNEGNKQETASAAPNLINQENSVGTESGQANFDSTEKPDEPTSTNEAQPTKLPSSDPSSNENDILSTTQSVSNKNDDVKVDLENNSNEIPDNNSIQDGIASNLPVASTENSVESGTQSYNVQDKPQEDITTENIAVFEKGPIESNDNDQTPEKHSDTKPQTETASNGNENPTKIENQDSAHSDILSPTEIPKVVNEPTEQNKPMVESTSGAEKQLETDKIAAEQINQDSPQSENVSPTDVPKVENESTEQNKPVVPGSSGASNQPESDNTAVEQNNPDSPQSENSYTTEIPKLENEPIDQNKPVVDSTLGAENQPGSDKTPVDENKQDSSQSENVSPTEFPNVVNNPTEQNKPVVDSTSGAENQSETDRIPVEQINQDSAQSVNVSPTDVPKVENEPTEQNNLVVDNASGGEHQPESDKTPVDQNKQDSPQSENVSPTEIPKVVNEPTEQNKPVVGSTSGVENQSESDKTPSEQINQDSPQSENVSPTDVPKVSDEPTEQNKPEVGSTSGAENQSESDKTPSEQINQDSPQSENVSPTDVPKVADEPTEQNKPEVGSISGAENQSESDKTPVEQINQDTPQSENVSPTEIPKVVNEPTDQNKPVVGSTSGAENQSESDKTPAEQINQDSPQSENVSPTDVPKVADETNEQNKPVVDSTSGAENQSESDKTPAEQINQDIPQSENVSPTEVPKVADETNDQNKPVVDSTSGAENQSESDKTPAEQINQDSPQSENVSPTDVPKVADEPTEQNKPVVGSTSGAENQSESDKTPAEQINQDSPQSENVSPTDVPKVADESTEQNKPVVGSTSGVENQSESDKTPVEQINQDTPQSENVSSTEIPKVVNEPTEQNKPVVDGTSEAEKQPETDRIPVEQINQDNLQAENVPTTDVPKVENEPTEQNKPVVDITSGAENQPESNKTPIDQNNQDSSQAENVSPTEFPNVVNDPTEQNKPVVDSTLEAENQPEFDNTAVDQNNPVSSQAGNLSPTEIPKVVNDPTEQNKPAVDSSTGAENQQESDKTPAEQINQDSPQSENVSPTGVPNIENESTGQNKPAVDSTLGAEDQSESDKTPVGQNNQDSLQTDYISPTDVPKVENEPTEQNKPTVDSSMGAENHQESDKTSAEQINQDSAQSVNVSPTDVPKVENEPTEQNNLVVDNASGAEHQPESDKTPVDQNKQESPQSENFIPTDIPKIENEPTEQNKPLVDSTLGAANQPNSDETPVDKNNQDSSQSENVSPTEITMVANDPTEQIRPAVDSSSDTQNLPESDKTPVEQINQDSPETENLSSTEIPKVVNEPTEQNKPLVDSTSGEQNQPESDKTTVEQINLDSPQTENVSSTDVPKVENEPIEQNKPVVDSTLGGQNQPESDKTPVEQNNQGSPQSENTYSTEIPSKPYDIQSENIVPENSPIQPVSPVASENNAATEQPNEDNNIFIMSPTSPPLFSDNQIKGEESTSISNINNTSDKYSSTEKDEDKTVEVLKPSADDKPSFSDTTDKVNILPTSHTETVTEGQNVVPQANDEYNENSINIKPVDNKVNSDVVTESPVNSNENVPVIAEHNDNKFGSNNPVNLEPAVTPMTGINYDVNTEVINHGVSVDDPSSHENQPVDEHSGEEDESPPNADSVDHQITLLQTETPTESEASTNKYPSSSDEHANDVTTYSPQLQIADNNIPVQPQVINPSDPITTQDETKTPNDLPSNGSPNQSADSYVPTEINGVQNSEAPTEFPVLFDSNDEQSISTQAPAQNNEYENATPHEQSQDENVNEIVDQTAVYPDAPSDDTNNLVTSTAPNLNNVDNVTPSSDKIETGLNSQISDEKPIKDTNGDVLVESATIQAISGSVDNADNLMTTNSYADVVPSTDIPTSQMVENGSPVNPSIAVETNVNNDRPENVVPQLSSNEESTQYNAGDESTNSPIQESPNMNIINNVEVSTNVPYKLEGPNEINQDSNTESELYATQSPTENNILNANPIVDEKPSESPQNADKPFVSKTPDYVIDITTTGYSESSNTPESIITNEPVDSVNEVTTSNVDKNSDVVTEQYENVQPGVPGEGSCLIDFVTYAHKAEVPKSNPCHEKCECLNSIVTCTSVNCPPAPPQHRNCIPLHPGNESWCCPTYMCEGGIEGMLFDSHNQLGSPQLISTVVLEDKPGEVNDEKTHTDEDISSTSNPQTSQEYNTLAPSQLDSNSNINSEDSVGVTDVPAHTEIPYKPIEDVVSTDGESDAAVTAVNLGTIDNTKPVSSDPSLENEKPAYSDKTEEYEKPEENNKPTESDQLTENNKPTEINQAIENQKPIENSEADSTTTSYVTDDQSITNKPETINNIEEQNLLVNTVNESQDQVPSTQVPENYEPAVTNVIPASDQNQPEQNSESDVSIAATTYKPSGSVLDQQQVDTDNKASEGFNNPSINDDSNQKPANEVMDLPVNEVDPLEVGTQMPTVVADEKPMVSDNNVGGLRPTSIDDIISSVYLVKDAVKNSLETSSKPTETLEQQPGLFEEDNQPTIVPENSPQYEYTNEPPTTVSSVNGAPESQQTDTINEISPEIPTATMDSNISPSTENVADAVVGATQIPNILPQSEVNSADQGVSTDLPSNHPGVETAVDDNKTPLESPTTQRLPSSGEQDLTNNNGLETPSDQILPHGQNAVEPNTNSSLPELAVVVDDNKTPEVSSPSSEQHGVHVEDTAVVDKPVAEEKPDDVNSQITPDSDVPAGVPSQVAVTGRPEASTPDNNDNRFSDPSSSSFRPPVQGGNVNNHYNGHPRPETGGAVHIPLDTETPTFNPSTNAPLANYPKKPSYTPIPQSTWTQKPFHQESTSEATLQPDQGFPDEYEDENEASYGSGTCRYGGKIYVSAQQVPRDDPCDFCFCFRGDIICLQQSCPPPIFGCYQENIQGFCCPRYECPVAQTTSVNVTTSTTSTTTVVPPHFFANAYRGAARRTGCLIHGHAYRVGEDVGIASGPCLECICGADGKMKCDPKPCSPEPLLRKMMAEAIDQKRR